MCIRPFLLGLLPFLAGCSLVGNDADLRRVETYERELIFTVRPSVVGDPSEPWALGVGTAQTFGCLFPLAHRYRQSGTSRRFEPLGIKTNGVCLTVNGPATATVPFADAPGTYTLRFARDGVTDTYQVRIGTDTVEVAPHVGAFTRLGPVHR